MANQYVNKVVYAGDTLIDLTSDTLITADQLVYGIVAHARSGATITGTNTNDADTSDATATASQLLSGATAYVNGSKVTGTMANRGAVSGAISTKSQVYTVPVGYHDGSGTVQIASAQQALLIPENIREGITVLGVEGEMSGSEDMAPQSKTVTPTSTAQTVTPDTGYNCLSQVTVNAIPYSETDNDFGGKTVTIAAA